MNISITIFSVSCLDCFKVPGGGLLPDVSASEVGDCQNDEDVPGQTDHRRHWRRRQRRRHDPGTYLPF